MEGLDADGETVHAADTAGFAAAFWRLRERAGDRPGSGGGAQHGAGLSGAGERGERSERGWPLPPELTDTALEQLLFPQPMIKPGVRRHPEPDWAVLAREMKRPGVSLMILWEEYQAANPQFYGYSRFCELYRAFERRLSPVMRQTHAAGHKAFVDYSGKKVPIVDPLTGEVRMAELFIPPASRNVLLTGRLQRSDRRGDGGDERSGDAPVGRQPVTALRGGRTPGDASTSSAGL